MAYKKAGFRHRSATRSKMPKPMSNVYERFCLGEHLTMGELELGLAHFNQLSKALYESGPAFSLAAKEAARVAEGLQSYLVSRRSTDR